MNKILVYLLLVLFLSSCYKYQLTLDDGITRKVEWCDIVKGTTSWDENQVYSSIKATDKHKCDRYNY